MFCGATSELTFDHINGRDWDIRRVHATKRMRIYTEEAAAGLLQLLCLSCNSSRGQPVPGDPVGPNGPDAAGDFLDTGDEDFHP